MSEEQAKSSTVDAKAGLAYSKAGVDTGRADAFLAGLVGWVSKTSKFRPGVGRPVLDIGYYASVVDLGRGLGLAVSTDGVGTKILVAEQMRKYDTIGIDCIAMNVNDVICVGAEPIGMLDYLAVEDTEPEVGEQIGKGLYDGAEQAEICISGGELAQLKDMIKGHAPGTGLDLAGMAYGLVDIADVNLGRQCREGDVVIGVGSSGLHSNGYTLARHVLFEQAGLKVDTFLDSLGTTVGAALLEPTRIYVKEFKALKRARVPLHAILHITGEGLFNMNRVDAPVGFVLDQLPEPAPLFQEIAKRGNVPATEMYRVFNMGIGMFFVVPQDHVQQTLSILREFPMPAQVCGRVVHDPEKKILVPQHKLLGKDDRFFAMG